MKMGASLDQATAFGMRPKDYAAIFLIEKGNKLGGHYRSQICKERIKYSKGNGMEIYKEILK